MNMHKRNERQAGIVSLIVTLVMMLVISLVVIGFTQVTNRTQREALDRQLATQAQYAAESGVNKVGTIIDNAAIVQTKTKTTCDNNGVYAIGNGYYSPTINSTNNVSVTCVLVDTRPSDIRVSANQTSSTIVPITVVKQDGTPRNAGSLTFTWQPESQSDTPDCSSFNVSFPASAADCNFGLLRVDLVRGNAAGDADALMGATTSFYMKPTSGAGATYTLNNASPKGNIVNADCSPKTTCTATVTLNDAWNIGNFYARLSTLYHAAPTVVIDAPGDASFEGAQAVIDSTGKAQDVLKRIQVRYPIGVRHDDTIPPFALQSDATICKKFTNIGSSIVDNCGL